MNFSGILEEEIFFQYAILFTSIHGARTIRVFNLTLKTSSSLGMKENIEFKDDIFFY